MDSMDTDKSTKDKASDCNDKKNPEDIQTVCKEIEKPSADAVGIESVEMEADQLEKKDAVGSSTGVSLNTALEELSEKPITSNKDIANSDEDVAKSKDIHEKEEDKFSDDILDADNVIDKSKDINKYKEDIDALISDISETDFDITSNKDITSSDEGAAKSKDIDKKEDDIGKLRDDISEVDNDIDKSKDIDEKKEDVNELLSDISEADFDLDESFKDTSKADKDEDFSAEDAARIDDIIAKLDEDVDNSEKDLDANSDKNINKLDKHEDELVKDTVKVGEDAVDIVQFNEDNTKLDKNTAILNEHMAILDEDTTVLDENTAILNADTKSTKNTAKLNADTESTENSDIDTIELKDVSKPDNTAKLDDDKDKLQEEEKNLMKSDDSTAKSDGLDQLKEDEVMPMEDSATPVKEPSAVDKDNVNIESSNSALETASADTVIAKDSGNATAAVAETMEIDDVLMREDLSPLPANATAANAETMETDDVLMREDLSPLPADAFDIVPEGAMEDLLLGDDPNPILVEPTTEKEPEKHSPELGELAAEKESETSLLESESTGKEVRCDDLSKDQLIPNPVDVPDSSADKFNLSKEMGFETDPVIKSMVESQSGEVSDAKKDKSADPFLTKDSAVENDSTKDQIPESSSQKSSDTDVAVEKNIIDSKDDEADASNKVMMSPDPHSETSDACVDDELGLLAEATVKNFDEDEDEHEDSSDGNLDDEGIDEDEDEVEDAEVEDAEDEEEGDAEDEAGESGENDESAYNDEEMEEQFAPTIAAISGSIKVEKDLLNDDRKKKKRLSKKRPSKVRRKDLNKKDEDSEAQSDIAATSSEEQDSNSGIRVEILPTTEEDNSTKLLPIETDKLIEEEMTIDEDLDFKTIAADLNVDLSDIAVADTSFDENIVDAIMQTIADEEIDVKVRIPTPEPLVSEDEETDKVAHKKTPEVSPDSEKDDDSNSEGVSEAGSDFQLRIDSDEESDDDLDTEEGLLKKKEREERETLKRKTRADTIIKRLKNQEKKKEKEKEEKLKANHDEIDKQLSELDKFISEKLEKSFIENAKMIKTEKADIPNESDQADNAEAIATPAIQEPKDQEVAEAQELDASTVAEKESAEEEPVEKEPVEKEPAEKEPVEKEPAEKEPVVEPVPAADVEMVESSQKSPEVDDIADRSPEPMDTVEIPEIPEKVPSPKKPEEKSEEPTPEVPKRQRLRLDDRAPTEILDLESDDEDGIFKKKEKCYICVNASCNTPSDGKWLDCPIFVLSYFKVKRRRKEQQKVCEECFEEVVQHYERLAYCVVSGNPICAMEHKVKHTDFVEISDSESEEEDNCDFVSADGIRMEDQDFITDNLIQNINETWDKYDMQKQVDLFTEDLKLNLVKVEKDTEDLNTLFTKLQNTMDTIAMNLYQSFKPDVLEVTPLFIDSIHAGEENTDIQTFLVEEQLKQANLNEENQNSLKDAAAGDDAEVSVVRQDIEHAPQDLPPPGELKLRIPRVSDVVFAVKKSAFGAWGRAEVLEVWPKGSMLPSGAVSAFTICRVRFESKNKPNLLMKSLTGRQIAIFEPVLVRLDVGTRVIAMFKDQDNVYKEDIYYSGVIAEPPKPVNGFRYLVFFDDGYAQYAEHSRLLVVCEHSPRVWEDVHPDSRDFVRKYLQGYPERPMVRLQRGQQLKTEWNGAWWWCTVIDVDASLAKISFPEGRQEWVYRGSTRLAPLYRELATLPGQPPVQSAPIPEIRNDTQQMAPPAPQALQTPARSHATARRSMAARSGMNMPYVEYTNADKDAEPEVSEANKLRRHADAGGVTVDPPKRQAVAKKSTTTQPQPQQPPPKKNEASDQFTSRVVYYAPKSYIKPHKMVSHKCSFKCQRQDVLPLRAIKNYNPLAKPILAGWERLFERFRGRKVVMYRSPCGRRLRSIQELHQYLRITESEMSIDLFCFDHNVHCLGEFVLNKCFAIKKDITQGRENIPIPCVNYYDDKMPEFCVYSTTRTPTRGVSLNLSDEFLSGCDCTDDCLDKSKCQCWQLTYDGASFMGVKDLHRVGYQYKRLPDSVQTGIYECNSRCKCAKTCLNRVVQHPLQLKLQVFKTFNRGWGIRALNDLPKGTFICVYAGNLLTDATANEDGLIEGDEYLAELDYIEVVENLKLDYEADIPEGDKDLDRRNIAKKPSSKGRSSKSASPSDVEESDKSDGDENTEKRCYEQDTEFRPEYNVRASNKLVSTRLRTRQDKDRGSSKDSEKEKGPDNLEMGSDDTITISDDEEIREPSRFAAPEGIGDGRISKYRSVRSLFGGEDEACYIMDAKVQGNIGRYLNHSCSPNVFVQNVFVDTHDPRFPWVAFFALTYIRAGTELTWDYNYDVGSVHGKVILCKCGATNCRGRLL